DGEQGLPFWPLVVLTAGIGGYAAAKVKSADDEKRRNAALRSLFGEDDDKLNDENEGACPMNCDADQPDYERRIDALCEALFHGDELLGANAAAREDSAPSCQAAAAAWAPPRRQQSQRVLMCVERRAPRSPKRPRRRLPGRPICGAAATLWLLACLVLAGWLGLRSPTAGVRSARATTGRNAAKADNHASVAIENIRVGQRVLGENPELVESEHSARTAIDRATWRLLKLHSDCRWADGTLDTVEVETLQPPSWIVKHCAREGSSVPLPLDVTEMGMPEDLRATVLAIEPCPEIPDGPGHVVTTTINHLNAFICELSVEDTLGHRETIKPTGYHKFYSDTRQGWVSASQLDRGERLRGVNGPLTVIDIHRIPGVERVYNMTVEGQHVYHVSAFGVLVHNECPPPPSEVDLGPDDLPPPGTGGAFPGDPYILWYVPEPQDPIIGGDGTVPGPGFPGGPPTPWDSPN
ncbi:MAG: polymorphic toxin-type HINT domain-containing protein, partial [Pirellulales bacterium]